MPLNAPVEPSTLDASFGGTANERLALTGIDCEDGKRFSCPKKCTAFVLPTSDLAVFPRF